MEVISDIVDFKSEVIILGGCIGIEIGIEGQDLGVEEYCEIE